MECLFEARSTVFQGFIINTNNITFRGSTQIELREVFLPRLVSRYFEEKSLSKILIIAEFPMKISINKNSF